MLFNGTPDRLLSTLPSYTTEDLDEAREIAGRALIPHSSELLRRGEHFYSRLCYVPLTDLTIGSVVTRGELRIVAGPAIKAFQVLLALHGWSEHCVDGEAVPLGADWGVVHSPHHRTRIRTNDDVHILGANLSRSAVEEELSRLLDRPIGRPLVFAPGLSMRGGVGPVFRRWLLRVCEELNRPERIEGEGRLGLRQLERSLLTLLLEGHRHNYSKLLHSGIGGAPPWQVRAVEEYIRAHAERPISLGDLAAVAGVSARTLQYGFQSHRAYSPLQFLRATRLDRVRQELLRPLPDTSVTSAAMRWGFLHLGRFAAEYRRAFRESPSRTLLRSRLRHF